MKSIYFIQSYPQLNNLNRYLHLSQGSDHSIIVIGNKHLFEYLKDYVGIDNITFLDEVSFSYKNIFSVVRAKKYLKSLKYIDWRANLVYFSSYEFVGALAVIIASLRHYRVRVVHLADPGCDVYTSTKMRLTSFVDVWKFYVDRFVFGKVFEYAFFTPKLNRKYVRRLSIEVVNDLNITIESNSQMLSEFPDSEHSEYVYTKAYESCKILIVLKDMIGQGLVNSDNYVEQWNLIKVALLAHYDKSEIWIKAKPGKKTQIDIELFDTFPFVPDCIPFENVKLDSDVKMLGFSSTAMANSKYKTISLLDMFIIIKEGNVDRSKRVLKSRSINDIHYPNNIEELLHIIV